VRGIESAFWGVLGKDPELSQGKNGKPYCNFGCAVTAGQDENQWINVICFNETAEKLAEAARKGERVYCEGNLTLATWENGEGKTRSGLAVSAWKVERLANIGRNRVRQPHEPDEEGAPEPSLPAHKRRKAFGLFRKAKKAEAPKSGEYEFDDPLPDILTNNRKKSHE